VDFDNINPPVQYEPIWIQIFAIALAVIALYVIVTLIATKKKKPKAEPYIDRTSQAYRETVRKKHMDNIQQLRAEALSGDLKSSDLNQRLGVILRSFAAEYSGLNTRPMTLSELRRNNVPKELITAIEGFYPIAFRNLAEQGNPDVAVNAAMDVVYKWL